MFDALMSDDGDTSTDDEEAVDMPVVTSPTDVAPSQTASAVGRTSSQTAPAVGRTCSECGQLRSREHYSKRQWKARDTHRLCMVCTQASASLGTAAQLFKDAIDDPINPEVARFARLRLNEALALPPRDKCIVEEPLQRLEDGTERSVDVEWQKAQALALNGAVSEAISLAAGAILNNSRECKAVFYVHTQEFSPGIAALEASANAAINSDSGSDCSDAASAHIVLCFCAVLRSKGQVTDSALRHIDIACGSAYYSRNFGVYRHRSAMHAMQQNWALSLQDARRAAKLCLTDQKSQISYEIGQSLQMLGRKDEAILELRKFVDGAPSGDKNAVIALYSLCHLHLNDDAKSRQKEGESLYHEAVERELQLPEELQKQVDGDAKMVCQLMMSSKPTASRGLAGNACARCGTQSSSLRLCGACKRVEYCSKDCQQKHWKAHRQDCAGMKKEKKQRSNDAKITRQSELAALSSPCVDEAVNCEELWSEGHARATKADMVGASRAFCCVIFMANQYDAKVNTHIKEIANSAGDQIWGPLLCAIHQGASQGGRAEEEVCTSLSGILVERELHEDEELRGAGSCSPAGTTFDTEDPLLLALAIAHARVCRAYMQHGSSTMDMKHTQAAAAHARKAAEMLDPRRYLTLMFELAYSLKDIMAVEESERWHKLFLEKAPDSHPLRASAQNGLVMLSRIASVPFDRLQKSHASMHSEEKMAELRAVRDRMLGPEIGDKVCGAVACSKIGSKKCGQCGLVRYCSAICQKQDWTDRHREACKKVTSASGKSVSVKQLEANKIALKLQDELLKESPGTDYVIRTDRDSSRNIGISLSDLMGQVFFRCVREKAGAGDKRSVMMMYDQLSGNVSRQQKQMLRTQLTLEYGIDPLSDDARNAPVQEIHEDNISRILESMGDQQFDDETSEDDVEDDEEPYGVLESLFPGLVLPVHPEDIIDMIVQNLPEAESKPKSCLGKPKPKPRVKTDSDSDSEFESQVTTMALLAAAFDSLPFEVAYNPLVQDALGTICFSAGSFGDELLQIMKRALEEESVGGKPPEKWTRIIDNGFRCATKDDAIVTVMARCWQLEVAYKHATSYKAKGVEAYAAQSLEGAAIQFSKAREQICFQLWDKHSLEAGTAHRHKGAPAWRQDRCSMLGAIALAEAQCRLELNLLDEAAKLCELAKLCSGYGRTQVDSSHLSAVVCQVRCYINAGQRGDALDEISECERHWKDHPEVATLKTEAAALPVRDLRKSPSKSKQRLTHFDLVDLYVFDGFADDEKWHGEHGDMFTELSLLDRASGPDPNLSALYLRWDTVQGLSSLYPNLLALVIDDQDECCRKDYALDGMHGLAQLQHLELRLSGQWMLEGSDSLAICLGHLTNLQYLHVDRVRDGTWAELKAIEGLTKLKKVAFSGSNEIPYELEGSERPSEGNCVQLNGLKKKKKRYNGKRGVCKQYIEDAHSFEVILAGCDTTVTVSYDNLKVIQPEGHAAIVRQQQVLDLSQHEQLVEICMQEASFCAVADLDAGRCTRLPATEYSQAYSDCVHTMALVPPPHLARFEYKSEYNSSITSRLVELLQSVGVIVTVDSIKSEPRSGTFSHQNIDPAGWIQAPPLQVDLSDRFGTHADTGENIIRRVGCSLYEEFKKTAQQTGAWISEDNKTQRRRRKEHQELLAHRDFFSDFSEPSDADSSNFSEYSDY